MKLNEYFDLREFVSRAQWDAYGEGVIKFLDPRIVDGMTFLREWFDAPITINNWHTGGRFQERGLRALNTTTGARMSQHKFGRAVDFNVQGMSAKEVFDEIIKYWNVISPHETFTTLEDVADTPTWTHIDCRWTLDNTKPNIVKP
jgi:hypothetical protein